MHVSGTNSVEQEMVEQGQAATAGLCRGLEIVKQYPETTALNMATRSLQKMHKRKHIPLVMLGCLVVHRLLEIPTLVA